MNKKKYEDMKTMFYIENNQGEFWGGKPSSFSSNGWGYYECRVFFVGYQLELLNLDAECCPENFFDNGEDDRGWGDTEGNIFARVRLSKERVQS